MLSIDEICWYGSVTFGLLIVLALLSLTFTPV